MKTTGVAGLLAVAGLAASVSARPIFPEVEPNDNKGQANAFTLGDGDGVTGTTTGSSTTTPGIASADYFRLRNTPRPLGIYRHRLILTSPTVGHTASIRGLTQSDLGAGIGGSVNAGTDATLQTSLALTGGARMNQWYGFGKAEELYYRVTGTSATTANYVATLETEPVIPTEIGVFPEGTIRITSVNQGHTTDTDLWIYDANFNAIAGYGNDDTPAGPGGVPPSSLQSTLVRNYTPGVYYIAISNFNVANNLPSPGDDNFRTGSVVDFPDLILNSSTTSQLQLAFFIGPGGDTIPFKDGPFDIWWGKFTVIPAPGALALLGLGGLVAARRRR
jgi:hypothetical protein